MNSAFKLITGLTAALMISCVVGCGPAAPTSVDTSTDSAPAATSNTTAGAEMPAGETP